MRLISYQKYSFSNILCAASITALQVAFTLGDANAQTITLPGGGSVGGSGTGVDKINNLLQFVIEQALLVGASLSTVFLIGVVFAIKFGWMEKSKVKDVLWLIMILVAAPTVIAAIYDAVS
jgi:hypothetical protein